MRVAAGERPELTRTLSRGVIRHLTALGAGALPEFILPTGRRLDVMALLPDGRLWAVEVKSGVEDFRSDAKWPEYRDYCDALLFAVAPEFPRDLLPDSVGILVADGFDAVLEREPVEEKLHPSRRKALTLAFGLAAARRLVAGV